MYLRRMQLSAKFLSQRNMIHLFELYINDLKESLEVQLKFYLSEKNL